MHILAPSNPIKSTLVVKIASSNLMVKDLILTLRKPKVSYKQPFIIDLSIVYA